MTDVAVHSPRYDQARRSDPVRREHQNLHGEDRVEVRVDYESWEDLRPKAAVAASVGAGGDIVLGWYDDAFQYQDKVVELDDVAT